MRSILANFVTLLKKHMSTWSKFCGWLLKTAGWKQVADVAEDKVAVILMAPHTSMLDFVVCYLFYTCNGVKPHALVKKESFFWPLGPILRALGAIPLDRRNPVPTIKGVIDTMKESDERYHIALAPEGTRKPVKKWKTGYHTIARALECPVYLGFVDWGKKQIGYTEFMIPGDDARADTEMIQRKYETYNLTGRHPDKFITR